jgi:hypothetical protein
MKDFDIDSIELGEPISPIEKFIKDLECDSDSEFQLQPLKLALSIKQGYKNLNAAQKTSRRDLDTTAELLINMVSLADKAREESSKDNYYLSTTRRLDAGIASLMESEMRTNGHLV